MARLEAAGHRVVVPGQARGQWRYFAGTDEERLAGFHRLLDDPAIDVMLAARGGYGITRLLPAIDWDRVGASGKVFVGLQRLHRLQLRRARLRRTWSRCTARCSRSTSATASPTSSCAATSRRRCGGRRTRSPSTATTACPRARSRARSGAATCRCSPTWSARPTFPAIDGGILYVEEIAEEPYAIERLFLQLHHAGVLARQGAILLGDFTDCVPKNPARYPYAMDEVVETLRAFAPCPVLTGLPFGHVARKLTLPFGMRRLLALDAGRYTLSWPGLARP